MNGSFDHHPELDPALRALGDRLAGLGRAHAAERPGLADRVFAASRAELRGGAVVGRVGFASAVVRRWSFAAAAAVLLAASVAVYMRALPATKGPAGDIAAARSAVLGPASGSESLLVALIDQEAALLCQVALHVESLPARIYEVNVDSVLYDGPAFEPAGWRCELTDGKRIAGALRSGIEEDTYQNWKTNSHTCTYHKLTQNWIIHNLLVIIEN
jgi:hypothetical protein